MGVSTQVIDGLGLGDNLGVETILFELVAEGGEVLSLFLFVVDHPLEVDLIFVGISVLLFESCNEVGPVIVVVRKDIPSNAIGDGFSYEIGPSATVLVS